MRKRPTFTIIKLLYCIVLYKGTAPILEEQVHIKDAVSKIVVELMKHEWPNLWPTLLADLHKLCLEGVGYLDISLCRKSYDLLSGKDPCFQCKILVFQCNIQVILQIFLSHTHVR